MLSKCFNPDCAAHFLHLHTGKLFRFDFKGVRAQHEYGSELARGVEFFWLCDKCAGKLTLVADAAHQIRAVPLHSRSAAAATRL